MGTPDFAVASLTKLLDAGFNVVSVITAPDKPAGRGMKLSESAVKKFAVENNIPVLQPEKLKNPDFLEQLRSLKAELQLVVAFRMLPQVVWQMPPMGTINLHASLLPQYRGAAPINWAIIDGQKETGVTTFKLRQEIDTGDILLQESFPIGDEETAGELHDRMKWIGADVLARTVKGVFEGSIIEKPQLEVGSGMLKAAPKIDTETCRIQWDQPALSIFNRIRGLSPFPGAFTLFEGKTMKIFRSRREIVKTGKKPGFHETDSKTYLRFACADGWIYCDEIQMEGKKKMFVADFLRGYRP
ncbi:MAG: methionyl-tRNA formyltransferase [Bacteroidetes bacterium]|nr:MAG: methionyl-tRNA formyltransferase [Bacteroidota bacterium]